MCQINDNHAFMQVTNNERSVERYGNHRPDIKDCPCEKKHLDDAILIYLFVDAIIVNSVYPAVSVYLTKKGAETESTQRMKKASL